VGLEYSSHPLGNIDMFQEVSPPFSHPELISARPVILLDLLFVAVAEEVLGSVTIPSLCSVCGIKQVPGGNPGKTIPSTPRKNPIAVSRRPTI
jgi:hypothetical protein